MKLQDRLPCGVTVDGHFYRLNFDFRNVLDMLDVFRDENLLPESKQYLALRCLTKHPRNVDRVLDAVRGLLFDETPSTEKKRVTSFEQDAGMICAAFYQVYKIDLTRDKLHWLTFVELLRNLPEGNRYTEVIGIRSRPMPAPTKYNAAEREWLMKAKAECALHLDDAEAAKKYETDVARIFAGLLAMIPPENKDGEADGRRADSLLRCGKHARREK